MNRNKQLNMIGNKKSNPIENPENYFFTYDLGCTASLISSGYELLSLNKQNPKKVLFIFKRKNGIDEAVNNYFGDKLKVNARTLIDNIKMIKNRIYSSL